MPDRSAGILLYRRTPGLEVFIAHMGGPFWGDAAWFPIAEARVKVVKGQVALLDALA